MMKNLQLVDEETLILLCGQGEGGMGGSDGDGKTGQEASSCPVEGKIAR